LHLAALNGNTGIVAALLQAGADRTLRDFDDNTPFVIACLHGRLEAAEVLRVAGDATPTAEWVEERRKLAASSTSARVKSSMEPEGEATWRKYQSVPWKRVRTAAAIARLAVARRCLQSVQPSARLCRPPAPQ
jgi:ankyrin repeat protein